MTAASDLKYKRDLKEGRGYSMPQPGIKDSWDSWGWACDVSAKYAFGRKESFEGQALLRA